MRTTEKKEKKVKIKGGEGNTLETTMFCLTLHKNNRERESMDLEKPSRMPSRSKNSGKQIFHKNKQQKSMKVKFHMKLL